MNYDFIAKLEKANGYNEDRLYTQIYYANEVNDAENGKYTDLIEKAVDKAYASYERNGVVTLSSVKAFETDLQEMEKDCKKYELLLVSHAHIDMNWLWAYDETVAITLSTFDTMLKLMEEYPDYTFSQSQASVYEIVEKYDPEMLKVIKRRIKEGRWEVSASQWVEGDKNLASGEDLSRHLLQTKKYLSSLLSIAPESLNIAFEPDTFGHNQNMPEILAGGGVKYMYHCRGAHPDDMYVWRAPSGAKVTVFCEPEWYNEVIGKKSFLGYVNRMKRFGITKFLRVYGVGDHGGGATRRDLNRIKDMQTWKIMPTLTFSSYAKFFAYIDSCNLSLMEYEGELNKVFTGCYTSQSRIKKSNATNGRILVETEKALSMANAFVGKNYKSNRLDTPWREHLFSQFHDILPGSGVIGTREYAMGKSQEVKAKCATDKTYALRDIAQNLDTAKFIKKEKMPLDTGFSALAGHASQIDNQIIAGETGTGKERLFLVYNPATTEGDYIVDLKLWDYDGNLDFLSVTDYEGNALAFEVNKEGKRAFYHSHNELTVRVKIPALGYTVIRVSDENKSVVKKGQDGNPRNEYAPEYALEDEFTRVEVSPRTGAIVKIIDKVNGKTYENENALAHFTYLIENAPYRETAWVQGTPKSETALCDGVVINDYFTRKYFKNGALKKQLTYSIDFGVSSRLTVNLTLKNGVIEYNANVFFHEVDKDKQTVPALRFDLNAGFEKHLYDIPYGVIERKSKDRFDEPALSFVCGLDGDGKGLMLQSEGKNGFRGTGEKMTVSLLRNSYDPDIYPESCSHDINIKIAPVSFTTNLALLNQSERQRSAVCYVSAIPTKGSLPLNASLISVTGAKLTSVKPEGENQFVVRLVETEGKAQTVSLKMKNMVKAYLCDGIENEKSEIAVHGDSLTLTVQASTVNTVKIYTER